MPERSAQVLPPTAGRSRLWPPPRWPALLPTAVRAQPSRRLARWPAHAGSARRADAAGEPSGDDPPAGPWGCPSGPSRPLRDRDHPGRRDKHGADQHAETPDQRLVIRSARSPLETTRRRCLTPSPLTAPEPILGVSHYTGYSSQPSTSRATQFNRSHGLARFRGAPGASGAISHAS